MSIKDFLPGSDERKTRRSRKEKEKYEASEEYKKELIEQEEKQKQQERIDQLIAKGKKGSAEAWYELACHLADKREGTFGSVISVSKDKYS